MGEESLLTVTNLCYRSLSSCQDSAASYFLILESFLLCSPLPKGFFNMKDFPRNPQNLGKQEAFNSPRHLLELMMSSSQLYGINIYYRILVSQYKSIAIASSNSGKKDCIYCTFADGKYSLKLGLTNLAGMYGQKFDKFCGLLLEVHYFRKGL